MFPEVPLGTITAALQVEKKNYIDKAVDLILC